MALSAADISRFVTAYSDGQIVAYPTEAVFGLGCDPEQLTAVEGILAVKSRPQDKGVILIASHIDQLRHYVDFEALNDAQFDGVAKTWPGPYTWIVPKRDHVSSLLSGGRDTLAVRVSAHPIVKQLCDSVNKPMVSTSANPSGEAPARTLAQVQQYFADSVVVFDGEVDHNAQPTMIQDAITGAVLRR